MTRKRITLGLLLGLLAAAAVTLFVLDRDGRVTFKVASVCLDRASYLDYLLDSYENGGDAVRKRVVIIVRRMDDAAVDDLVAIFKDNDSVRNAAAAKVLFQARPEKGDSLLEFFKGDNPVLEERVLRSLRDLGTKAIPSLESFLLSANPNPRLQWWAITTLGRLHPPTEITIDALHGILVNNGNFALKIAAMRALAEIGTPSRKYLPTIVKTLEHADPELRAAAAQALGIFGAHAQDAVPHLVIALSDEDAIVRHHAWEALRKIQAGAGPNTLPQASINF